MPTFTYRARRPSGETVVAKSRAENVTALRDELFRNGLLLSEARRLHNPSGWLPGNRTVTPRWVLSFVTSYRQLHESGLPVIRILEFLQSQEESSALAGNLAAVRREVEAGKPLHEAMAVAPEAFPEHVRAAFQAGMRTGELPVILERLEEMLAAQREAVARIRAALAYPSFLAAALVVAVTIIMVFVLPQFESMYADFGAELPILTRLLMDFAENAPLIIAGLAPLLAVSWLGFQRWASRPDSRIVLDRVKYRLPLVGWVVRDLILADFCHMLAILLRSGTPLQEAIEHIQATSRSRYFGQQLGIALNSLRQGKSLHSGLSGAKIMPKVSLSLISLGEETGALATMLSTASAMHRRSLTERLDRIVALAEPVMMAVVGVVLGTIIIAIYMPILSIGAVVG